jgi:hypothetical protein
MMSKFTKPLALGFATAFFLTTSAATVLACGGRLNPQDFNSQSGQEFNSQSGQGPSYNGQTQSNGQFGNQMGRQLGARMGPGQGGQGQFQGGPGSQLGYGQGGPTQQGMSESIIFEIVDKQGCTTDACTTLVLQDAYGHRIQVGAVEFDAALTADASLEELVYHLAQNGSAVKGRLELGGQDGDTTRTYNLLVDKIYS